MEKFKLVEKIEFNFKTMMSVLESIIDPFNPNKSMLVTGASGIGKTYNLEKRLHEAHSKGDCNYSMVNAKCTAIGLYKALWEARTIGSVLLLDDVNVFGNEDILNLLKAAADTSANRIVTYQAASNELRKCGIPNQFEFKGKIIFITNSDLCKIADSNSALAPHVKAIMTRCLFIDLEIHDNESIMIHIENVINNTTIITDLGISEQGQEEILNFMIENASSLFNPSLRMPVQIGGLYLADRENWKAIASKVFLRG